MEQSKGYVYYIMNGKKSYFAGFANLLKCMDFQSDIKKALAVESLEWFKSKYYEYSVVKFYELHFEPLENKTDNKIKMENVTRHYFSNEGKEGYYVDYSDYKDLLEVNDAFIESALKELEDRKKWAENGKYSYSGDDYVMIEYQARIDEIENAIWAVNQAKLK